MIQTSDDTKKAKSEHDYFPLFIALIAIFSYIRILFLNNIFWDDHCWLQSIYTSNDIFDYLRTGFIELRRVPQGIVTYPIFNLFKITDQAFTIVHLITITIQIITPVFLYLLIYKLFQNRLAAFIIASILIIYPIDTTVPALTTLPYRLGLMFSVISFYLTQRAIAEKIRWFYMIIALLISGVSYYFLVESTIALEPARLFMIGLILHDKGYKKNEAIKTSLKCWLPFLLLCIPAVLYKLFYNPYGIYAGTYSSDILFFLKWKLHGLYLAMLFGGNWAYLLVKIEYLSYWSVISGLIALLTIYFMLKKYAGKSGFAEIGHIDISSCPEEKGHSTRINMIIVLGLLLLVPVVIMHEFASRKLFVGFDSRHGCIMQFGHALILGGLIFFIINKSFITLKHKKQFITLLMAALLGLGAFFNNLNLDQYFKIWEQEKQFYKAFMERFPALPKNSDFMFDIQMDIPLGYRYVTYNAEFPINMLYAESTRPGEFRSHKVTDWYYFDKSKLDESKYETMSHWGKDIFYPKELIVIRWQPGELLVNREIIKKYPNVEYKVLADKNFPLIPSVSTYPLRDKMNAFLGK